MLGLHCTHFLRHQYPPTPQPLFTTYPRTVRGPWASAVLLFHTDLTNRVHSSEEVSRRFTMTPCVIVERLQGKQRCNRGPVDEHAELQTREWPKWLFTEKRKVNEEQPTPQQPITQSRQRGAQTTPAHLYWCGAYPPSCPSCELTSQCSEIGFTFSPFSRHQNCSVASIEFQKVWCCVFLRILLRTRSLREQWK